jgi:hypothetical protein
MQPPKHQKRYVDLVLGAEGVFDGMSAVLWAWVGGEGGRAEVLEIKGFRQGKWGKLWCNYCWPGLDLLVRTAPFIAAPEEVGRGADRICKQGLKYTVVLSRGRCGMRAYLVLVYLTVCWCTGQIHVGFAAVEGADTCL